MQLQLTIDKALFDQYLVPPISLQVLMENAIKHNEFSDEAPLVIEISFNGDALVFCNEIRKKPLRKPSSKIGLKNLDERYKLTTGNTITIKETEKNFSVVLPVLKIA